MICNPPSKTDLTTLCSGDMLSPAPGNSRHIDGMGGLQIPRLIGRIRSAGYALSSVRRSGGYVIRRQKMT